MLDYSYFKSNYKTIAIDLSQQQALDADPKVIQQITFPGNLEKNETIVFIIEEVKKIFSDFSQGTVKIFFFFFFY